MIMALLLCGIIGLLVCVLLGMAFGIMQSAILALNRTRLLQLFAAEHPEKTDEQEIFRDTKDVYFVSRLGLSVALAVAGFCAYALFHLGLEQLPLQLDSTCRRLVGGALTVFTVLQIFLLCVFGIPRLILRQPSIEAGTQYVPWMRFFMRFAQPLARFARIRSYLPLGHLLPPHRLTKTDLVALVTDLEVGEKEAPAESEEAAPAATEEPASEEPDEEEIIYNILDLEETWVREVMRPINSVIAIRLSDLSFDRLRALAASTGYSRFPVYRERIVNLSGYVNVHDILHNEDASRSVESFIIPAYYVPEYMQVSVLLREFLERGIQVAVVVDEYGGCSGWVTREDVFDEIVGVFDPNRRLVREQEDGSYLVDGEVRIDELAEELPLTFEEPEYDTLAGFILMTLGILPAVGATVATDEAVFTVEKMDGSRIAEVRVRLPKSETEENQSGDDV